MPRGDSPGRSGCTSAFLLPRGAQLCTSHFSYGVERGRGARGRRLLARRRPELVRFRALAHASTRPRVYSGSLRYAPVVCQAPARAQRCGCESQTPLRPWGLSLVRTREAPWLCLGGQVSEKAAWRR